MEFVIYQVIQSFAPTPLAVDELAVKKDEILLIPVQSAFSENTSRKPGWLYAYNKRTGKEGYVPVETVKLLGLEENNTIHHPSALGVEAEEISINESEESYIRTSHQLKDIYLINPILCLHCVDYIWGAGKVAVKCSGKLAIKEVRR